MTYFYIITSYIDETNKIDWLSIYSNNKDSSKKSKGLIVNGFQICKVYRLLSMSVLIQFYNI